MDTEHKIIDFTALLTSTANMLLKNRDVVEYEGLKILKDSDFVSIVHRDKEVYNSRKDNNVIPEGEWWHDFHRMVEHFDIAYTDDDIATMMPQHYTRDLHTLHDDGKPRSDRANAKECVKILQIIRNVWDIAPNTIRFEIHQDWAKAEPDTDFLNVGNDLVKCFLDEADVVFWKQDMLIVATGDYEKMKGVTCDLPERVMPVMFWAWEHAPFDEDEQAIWVGTAVMPMKGNVFHARIFISEDPESRVIFKWQRMIEGQILTGPFDLIVHMGMTFMNLECVICEKQPISHKEAKRQRKQQKKNHKRKDPDIRLVEFKVPQRKKSDSQSSNSDTTIPGKKKRKYSCSFPVCGHWRNQPYPATDTYKLKWIDMHLGGDLSKPVKLSQKVYKVTRPRKVEENDSQ